MALVEHMVSKRAVRRDRGAARILRSLAGGVVPLLLAAFIVLPSAGGALSFVAACGAGGLRCCGGCVAGEIKFVSCPCLGIIAIVYSLIRWNDLGLGVARL